MNTFETPQTPQTPETALPGEPDPRDAQIAALNDQLRQQAEQIDELKAAAATTPETPATPETPTTPATSTIGAATPQPGEQAASAAAMPAAGQAVTTTAIAPGSSGTAVHELAQLVEAAGEKTYLSDPGAANPAHVFTDDLLDAVRRVLHNHPEIAAAEGAERKRLERWVGDLSMVTAEVWRLLEETVSAQGSNQNA